MAPPSSGLSRAGGGDTAQPLFDPRQVADWLISTGRADRGQIEPELSLYTLTGLAGQYPGTDLVAAVTALICLTSGSTTARLPPAAAAKET